MSFATRFISALCVLLNFVVPMPAFGDDPPAFALQWGSGGSGDGQFESPLGMGVDSQGYVYVADTGNNRIQKFNTDGVFVTKWGSLGSAPGQLNHPCDVAVDAAGILYVSDFGNSRINVYSPQLGFLRQWATSPQPRAIALDPAGANLYVATFGGAIHKYAIDGTHLGSWVYTLVQDPPICSFAVGTSGHIYVADPNNSILRKSTPDGQPVTQWGGPGTADSLFNTPCAVGPDPDENIYVNDAGNYRIQQFASAGGFLAKWGTFGSGPGQFSLICRDILSDPASSIYVLSGVTIQKFARVPTSTYPTTWGRLKALYR